MLQRAMWTGLALVVCLAPAHAGPDLEELLPAGWVVQAETPTGLDRVLPGAQSYFCHPRARGGYPYERILVGDDGTVLARCDGAAFLARAEAKRISARVSGDAWSIDPGEGLDLQPLLDAVRRRAPSVRGDPGRALTVSVALLDLLTYDGSFLSATVTPDKRGTTVRVDWEQGSATWSFEARGTWSIVFDRAGRLSAVQKERTSFAKHLRR